MERFSGFVLRQKLAVTLTWLALAVAGVLATSQIGGRLSAQNTMPGRPSYETNAAIARTYGTGGSGDPLVPVIVLPAGRTVDSPGVRAQVGRAFTAAATAVHGRAVSYADTGDRRLVGRDARTTFGFVYMPSGQGGGMRATTPTEPVTAAMRAALPPGATLRVTGMRPLESGGGGSGHGVSVLSETLVGGLGALAVLAFVFGSLLALVPLLIAACSILTSFLVVYGLTAVTDVSVIVQFIVALIGLGVAIDYSLLLVTRWREEQAAGHQGDEAVRRAMATAGRAIVFSGGAVAIGLVAMVVLPVPFLRSVGYGGIIIPVVSVVAVLTLLPVLLARFGSRIDRPRLRRGGGAGRGWTAWARGVVRFRWAAVAVSGAFLGVLAVAALGLHLGDAESDALASSGPAYEGRAALVRAGVPTGVLTPIDVLVPRGGDPEATAARLARVPGVVTAVAPDTPAWRRDGTALVTVVPAAEGGSAAGKDTARRVRAAVPAGTGVGGTAAIGVDFAEAVPALVSLFGRWNWWLPGWAARALRVRPAPLPPEPAREPVAAGRL
ncbi:MMPL family transporter [Actinoallomurus sp. NPDC050550]|uniref:MMPL family transporter n=1 Tax=Actinoallomurus sp. NPDC050550 TaxID=3154937 RepID=UPI0033FBA855